MRLALAPAVAYLLATQPAFAEDYGDASFSLRLPAALSRFSGYADVAGAGGASAGSSWSSSFNPAATAWRPVKDIRRVDFSPQYSNISFDAGTQLDVAILSASGRLHQRSGILATVAHLSSNKASTDLGPDFEFELDFASLQWGGRVTDSWAIGVNANYSDGSTKFSSGPLRLSKSDDRTWGIRVGALKEVTEGLMTGVVVDFARTNTDLSALTFNDENFAEIDVEDTTDQLLFRAGMSYAYAGDDSAWYLDYQYGNFDNDTGTLKIHRLYSGVDHKISRWLFLRAGIAADDREQTSWTAGLGIYPNDRFAIDIAFQDRYFPELSPELGDSSAMVLSLAISL